MYGSRVTKLETHKYMQMDMFAMMKAGVMRTFPEVARWLLLRSMATGSAPKGDASESDSPVAFSDINLLLLELLTISGGLGRYVVTTVSSDLHTSLSRPPQLEVSNEIVQGFLDEMGSLYIQRFSKQSSAFHSAHSTGSTMSISAHLVYMIVPLFCIRYCRYQSKPDIHKLYVYQGSPVVVIST